MEAFTARAAIHATNTRQIPGEGEGRDRTGRAGDPGRAAGVEAGGEGMNYFIFCRSHFRAVLII